MDRVQRREKKKKKKRRRLILAITLITIIIVASSYTIFLKPIIDNSYESIVSIKNSEVLTGFSMKDEKLIIGLDDSYKIISSEAINTYDLGKKYGAMELYSLDKNVLLVDRKSGELMLLNSSGEIVQKQIVNNEIVSIKFDTLSNVGIQVKENNTEKIIIYNPELKGSKIIEIENNTNIIDYAFDIKKNIIVISTVSYVDEIETNIKIMDIIGKKKKTVDFDGEITSNMYIDDNSEIIAVSDKKIFKMSLKGETIWEREVDISKLGYNDFNNALIVCQYQQEYTNVFLLNRDNKIIFEAQVKFKVEDIESKADKVILYGDKYVCEIRNSRIKTTKMYTAIRNLEILDNNQILIENEKKILLLKPFL